jgi:protein CpxP
MEKTKLLTLCVIGLILINFGLMGFMFMHRPGGMRPERKRDIVIEKLHFNENQVRQYDNIIRWHRSEIGQLEEKIHNTKSKLYLQLMRNEPDNKIKDSLIDVLSNYHAQVERTHFRHFEDLKKICAKEQMQNYYALTEELAQIFSRPQMPPHER